MEWPWVSRKYLQLNKDFAQQVYDALGTRLDKAERELDFYRDKFEAEKERADRAVDSLVQMCGREPISAEAVRTHEKGEKVNAEMQTQLTEIFGEVSESILVDSHVDDTTVREDEPEEIVKSIAERLTALQLLPRSRKSENSSEVPSDSRSIKSANSPETGKP